MSQTMNDDALEAMAAMAAQAPIPAHVPKDLIVDLSKYEAPSTSACPYSAGMNIHQELPPIFYTRINVGLIPHTWAVSRYEDIRRVYQDNEHYSTLDAAKFHKLVGEDFDMIPLGKDPPEHSIYRLFLTPWFTAKAIDKMEPAITATINELIDEFADKGGADLSYDFGRVYPVRVFMDLMGFPREMLEEFLSWGYAILHSQGDIGQVQWGIGSAIKYLREFVEHTRQNPHDGLASFIVHGEIDGRALSDDEIMGMVTFIWLGGLDTVAATSSLMFRRLAMEPKYQDMLGANPDLINGAIEEFLRVQPLVNSTRLVRKDHEIHGVTVRAGDHIAAYNTAGNFDPDVFDNPRELHFDRKKNKHWTLAGGSHLCLGAHLARRELRIALREVLRRIPDFRMKPGADLTAYPGLIAASHVEVVWKP